MANSELNFLSALIEASGEIAPELKLVALLTSLSFIPILLIAVTSFTRIIIVLSMLRHALGLQQTPPNIVLITLALFLSIYTMRPVWHEMNTNALIPYVNKTMTLDVAVEQAIIPLKTFMIHQTRDEDFEAAFKMAKSEIPEKAEEVELSILIPAFLMSELTIAFKIAFVIFIPFLLIDLVVASVLMSLGMIMLPPISIALPIKVMLFVLIDGWSLISQSLISGFS